MNEDLEELSYEEINNRLELFEERGFWFFPGWTMDAPITPDRIKLPSGKIVDINEINKKLKEKRKLQFGDREILELYDSLSYYNLIRALDIDERYRIYDQSFIDDADIERCRKKYSKLQQP